MRIPILAALAALSLVAPLAAQPIADGPPIPLFGSDAEKGWSPALTASPEGGFAAVWTTGEGLVARVFDADGTPLTSQASLVAPVSPFGGSPGLPKIAALSTGGYAVAWTIATPPGDLQGRFRILDAAGQPAGPEIELTITPPFQQEFVSVESISADATGHFVVGWTAAVGTFVRRFGADGTPATPEILIENGSGPAVAAFPDGRFVVGRTRAQLFGPAGNVLGPPFILSAGAVSDLQISAIADRFVTVWSAAFSFGEGAIVARLWDADGQPLGPEIVVAETAPCCWRPFGPQVVMRDDGSFLVLWNQDGDSYRVRQFDPRGRPVRKALPLTVPGGFGASGVEAVGDGWWAASPGHSPWDELDGPWIQHLISSCRGVAKPGLCL